jgi:glutathione S-transferase
MPMNVEYWGIRGLGHHVRCMAYFLELEFTETRLGMEDYAAYQTRKGESASNGNPLVNLPNIVDGEVFVSEASACVHYLCEKAGRGDMMNTTWKREQAASLVGDMFRQVTLPAYMSPSKEALVEALNPKFEGLAKFGLAGLAKTLGDQKFLFGDKPVAVDFALADLLEKLLAMDNELDMTTKVVKGNATWEAFLKRFYELPRIAAFRASESFIERPFNSPVAKWF